MSFTPTDITDEHRTNFRGYDVLGVLRTRLPYVHERARVRYLVERPFDVIEEFVVRSIVELGDMSGPETIAQVLGFGQATFVEPVTGRLLRMGLVESDDGRLRATDALAESFERRRWVEVREGEFEAARELLTGRRAKPTAPLREPTAEEAKHLSTHVSRTNAEEFTSWLVGGDGPISNARIHDVSMEAADGVGFVEDLDIVVYADEEDGMWWWEPFAPDKGRLAVEARAACVQLGADEAALTALRAQEAELPPSAATPTPSAAKAEALAHEEAPSSGVTVERYSTTRATHAIVERIGGATEEVIASFPWIKMGALTSDLLDAFRRALSAGASVYVTYGIAASPDEEESHPDAIAKLAGLRADNTGERVHVVWTGSSHVKEVVVDRRHYLGGSFNRLSFRGDPDSETGRIRRESVIYTDAPDVVDHCRQETAPLILKHLVRQNESAGLANSGSEWWGLWRPVLRLSLHEEALASAVRALPADANARVDALNRALPLIHGCGSEAVAKAAVEVLNRMLPVAFRDAPPPNSRKLKPFLKRIRKIGTKWDVDVSALLGIAGPTI